MAGNDPVLHRTTISLNGIEYALARREVLERVGRARSWQVERLPTSTKMEPRPDVRQGSLPDEYIITLDDFTRGVAGDHDNIPGTYFASNRLIGYDGILTSIGSSNSFQDTNAWGADPAIFLWFNYELFLLAGRYAFRFTSIGVPITDKDFGSGNSVTDAIVHNNEIVAGFGGSTKKIETRNTAGTWTEATDAVFVDYFARVEARLWRATATNEVSNIGPTDNPLTLANWSSGITVGDDDTPITDLNSINERLAVSKETGFHLGDAAAIFPNIFPQIESIRDQNNGKNTLITGDVVYYPHRDGLLRWTLGESAEEIGLQELYKSADVRDTFTPGLRISALAPQGRYLWAASEPGLYPRADPTGVKRTIDNEVSFTSDLADAIDNDLSTHVQLDSQDTAANGDYFYVGHSAAFHSVLFQVSTPNYIASVLTVQYWSGAAWTSAPGDRPFIDGTSANGKTLNKSGDVTWRTPASDWAASTIDGTNAFWLRFSVSVALSTVVRIGEIRIATSSTWTSAIFRGRPRTAGDPRPKSVIWDMVMLAVAHTKVTALYVSNDVYPFRRGSAVVAASRQQVTHWELAYNPIDSSLMSTPSADMWTTKMDGGLPFEQKQWTRIRAKMKTVGTTQELLIGYRMDEDSAFTAFMELDTSGTYVESGELNVAGRAIQLHLNLDWAAQDLPPEALEIEIIFRRRPSYKNVYTCVLELSDYQSGSQGTMPAAATQLDNLEDLTGAAPFIMIDPLERRVGGTSGLVTISQLQQIERVQEGLDYPVTAVEVVLAEV